MTRAEMDQIWVIDGMAYRIRDKWVSAETRRLDAKYQQARRQRDAVMVKRLSKELMASRDRDIAAALDYLRAA